VDTLRRSYVRISCLWPRDPTGLPISWSDTPSWIKQMIVLAYMMELGRRKLTLSEVAESDINNLSALPLCCIIMSFLIVWLN